MMLHEDKLVGLFKEIHKLDEHHDVRPLMDDYEITGVGFYKDDLFCWGASITEITFDYLMIKEQGNE